MNNMIHNFCAPFMVIIQCYAPVPIIDISLQLIYFITFNPQSCSSPFPPSPVILDYSLLSVSMLLFFVTFTSLFFQIAHIRDYTVAVCIYSQTIKSKISEFIPRKCYIFHCRNEKLQETRFSRCSQIFQSQDPITLLKVIEYTAKHLFELNLLIFAILEI